jgi:hypothetical protein
MGMCPNPKSVLLRGLLLFFNHTQALASVRGAKTDCAAGRSLSKMKSLIACDDRKNLFLYELIKGIWYFR